MFNLKFALRTLFKAPFVTTVAILSLALGIGANVAIFSLFDEVLVRSLPVQNPARLVNLSAPGPKPGNQTCNQSGDCDTVFTYPMYRDLERAQTVFEGLAAHRIFLRERRRARSDAERRCGFRVGQLLPRARPAGGCGAPHRI